MTLRDLKLRARALFRPNRVEQELNEELAFHIERETTRLIEDGVPPAEARLRAQARFGSTALAFPVLPRLSRHRRPLRCRQRIGIPARVRAITRRWISLVPS